MGFLNRGKALIGTGLFLLFWLFMGVFSAVVFAYVVTLVAEMFLGERFITELGKKFTDALNLPTPD